jgi:hypothetical protein
MSHQPIFSCWSQRITSGYSTLHSPWLRLVPSESVRNIDEESGIIALNEIYIPVDLVQ